MELAMVQPPQVPSLNSIRREDAINKGPFPFVIFCRVTDSLQISQLGHLISQAYAKWIAQPRVSRITVEADPIRLITTSWVSGVIKFLHPESKDMPPVPGVVVYGAFTWSKETSKIELAVFASALAEELGQDDVEFHMHGEAYRALRKT